MKAGHQLFRYAGAIALILVVSGMFLLVRDRVSEASKRELPASSRPQAPLVSPSTNQPSSGASTSGSLESVEDLSALLRKLPGDINAIYAQILPMRLTEKAWWRSATDLSSLLDVARDESVNEAGRIVSLQFFLAGVSQPELEKLSAGLQATFSNASDSMVSALLQGMADRNVSPQALIQQTLTNPERGENAKCLAWYAARLTQMKDPALAGIAIAASEPGMTKASKVAFDYLASGSLSGQYATNPEFRQKTDSFVATVQSLPADAAVIALANADAFIRALPAITPTDTAIDTLLSLSQKAQNPEMRLSAIEQLVSIHLSGAQDLSQELHEVRNQVEVLFSDPVKQERAITRFNRINTQGKSK